MHRRDLLVAAFAILLLAHSAAHGQRQTERFIPIGRSPGASGKSTRIGTVESVDRAARSFVLSTPEGRTAVQVPAATPIWLDRSRRKRPTRDGGFDDLRVGRRVEVSYGDAARVGEVRWIKVEVGE